jgi:hypothetical protein
MDCLLSVTCDCQAIENCGASFGLGFNNYEFCGFETPLMTHMPLVYSQISGTTAVKHFTNAESKGIEGFSLAMGQLRMILILHEVVMKWIF